ncbi:MAG: TolC family protein [Clostridia bacterium]|nr:TolC family protein [Clostridia bacterium]
MAYTVSVLLDDADARIKHGMTAIMDFILEQQTAWYTLLSADLTWQMSEKSYSIEEDQLVLDACQKYWDILKAEEKVVVDERRLQQAQQALDKTQALVRVGLSISGMMPELALRNAEVVLAKASTGLVTVQSELDSAYEALNQLIGCGAARPPGSG